MEITLTLENPEKRVQLFGSADSNLRLIREICEVHITARDGRVRLSGSKEAVSKAAKMGVCKVNIDTDLRMALTAKIRQVFAETPAEFDPRKYLGPGREAIYEMVKHKLQVLGCAGKAAECV